MFTEWWSAGVQNSKFDLQHNGNVWSSFTLQTVEVDPRSRCHCSLLRRSWRQELSASPSPVVAVAVVVVDIALLTDTFGHPSGQLAHHIELFISAGWGGRVQRALRCFVQASESRGNGLWVSVKHHFSCFHSCRWITWGRRSCYCRGSSERENEKHVLGRCGNTTPLVRLRSLHPPGEAALEELTARLQAQFCKWGIM